VTLKGKVAIITGGSSGIGRATALLFGQEGAKVVVVGYQHGREGREVVNAIKKQGSEALYVQADVSKEEDVRAMVAEAVRAFGGVDILFSNAGILLAKSVTDTTAEEWDRIMQVNLRSAFLCAKYVVPEMRRHSGGSIVIDSSVNGLMAEPNLAAYCASKGALIALTRSMSVDYGKYNIRVNCLCPGWIETPFNADYFAVPGNREKAAALHSLRRVGKPEEVACAALFLASDKASFISGSSLTVDGGLTSAFAEVF